MQISGVGQNDDRAGHTMFFLIEYNHRKGEVVGMRQRAGGGSLKSEG
jgi:hypothetical protein